MALTYLKSRGLASGVGGKVLQVVSTTKTDVFTTSSISTFVDITGLSVSITPSSASNKILIIVSVSGSGWDANTSVRLVRGSTPILVGDSGGGGQATMNFWTYNADNGHRYANYSFTHHYLDSPSTTSSTTYKMQGVANTDNLYIGQSKNDSATRTPCSITVMEIAV